MEGERRPLQKERYFRGNRKARNCPPMLLHGRCLHGGGMCHTPLHVPEQRSLDGTQQEAVRRSNNPFLEADNDE